MFRARNLITSSLVAFSTLVLVACGSGSPDESASTDDANVEELSIGKIEYCGGLLGTQCRGNQVCVDDPRDDCDPRNGGADCIGICRPAPKPRPQFCGGIANIPCRGGLKCVDNPEDSCDPKLGGVDCGGICVPDVCDSTRVCATVVTCVAGQLYPTACGPSNCDAPLGPCAEEI
jgi:hypothetical protein